MAKIEFSDKDYTKYESIIGNCTEDKYSRRVLHDAFYGISRDQSYGLDTDVLRGVVQDEVSEYIAWYEVAGEEVTLYYENGNLIRVSPVRYEEAVKTTIDNFSDEQKEKQSKIKEYGKFRVQAKLTLSNGKFSKIKKTGIVSRYSDLLYFISKGRPVDLAAYNLIFEDGYENETTEETFQLLDELGFDTPLYIVLDSVKKEDVESLLSDLDNSYKGEEKTCGYGYDGFNFGLNEAGSKYIGIKTDEEMYSEDIDGIDWVYEENQLRPIFKTKDGDLKIYDIRDLLMLGNEGKVYWRVDEEYGKIPCTKNGQPIILQDILK